MVSLAVKEQIKREFHFLSDQEVGQGLQTISGRLLKIRKVQTPEEADQYINESLTVLLDARKRKEFCDHMNTEDQDSRCRWSVYTFFANENLKKHYEASGMKAAVHNARGIFSQMPSNSKLTL